MKEDSLNKNKTKTWLKHGLNCAQFLNLIINKYFNHVAQGIPQQHVIVARVAQLIQRELNGTLDTTLDLIK